MHGPPLPDPEPPNPFFLGLPFWGHKSWAGSFYRPKIKASDHLRQYAQVFNTVEGNTTFYSQPSDATVRRWNDAVPSTFRFLFKLPRRITHELQLRNADEACDGFFQVLRPLAPKTGYFLIQLPPYFGPDQLPLLERFLAGGLPRFQDILARPVSFAVEARHHELYDPSPGSRHLDDILCRFGVERCWMDTRALRSGDPTPPDVVEACRKKPNLPTRVPAFECALTNKPLIRFVAHPDGATTAPWLKRWTRVLAQWLQQGRSPYFMVHLPNNQAVPELAAALYDRLARRIPLAPLPTFPAARPEPPIGGQLTLNL